MSFLMRDQRLSGARVTRYQRPCDYVTGSPRRWPSEAVAEAGPSNYFPALSLVDYDDTSSSGDVISVVDLVLHHHFTHINILVPLPLTDKPKTPAIIASPIAPADVTYPIDIITYHSDNNTFPIVPAKFRLLWRPLQYRIESSLLTITATRVVLRQHLYRVRSNHLPTDYNDMRCRNTWVKIAQEHLNAGTQGRAKRGDPRENRATRGILLHNSHMRKSGRDPTRNRTRVDLIQCLRRSRPHSHQEPQRIPTCRCYLASGWMKCYSTREVSVTHRPAMNAPYLDISTRASSSELKWCNSFLCRSQIRSRIEFRTTMVQPGISNLSADGGQRGKMRNKGLGNLPLSPDRMSVPNETLILLRVCCFARPARMSEEDRESSYDSDGAGKSMTGVELQTRAADPGCIVFCVYLKNALDY
ncbi:hypothetical protein PR048_014716 [Dryococelus australis]|uniref:Uncharacterized protein n=1 Tax=Dryococelus australis TaxID=614101 RepID=A0ABQ9HFT2_9NEOP|nr:hypothetical protein PR048_014716 [Dryococelus australis]